jgi:hypothetical protein
VPPVVSTRLQPASTSSISVALMSGLLVGNQPGLERDGVEQRAGQPVLQRGQALVFVHAGAGAVADGDDADAHRVKWALMLVIVSSSLASLSGSSARHQLEKLAVGAAVARQPGPARWTFGGWASLRAWRTRARSCWVSVPGLRASHSAMALVVGNQAVAPVLGQVQGQLFFGRAFVLLFQRGAQRPHGVFVQQAHELAHVLHLAALAFEVGDAFGSAMASISLSGNPRRSNRSARSVSSFRPGLQLGRSRV